MNVKRPERKKAYILYTGHKLSAIYNTYPYEARLINPLGKVEIRDLTKPELNYLRMQIDGLKAVTEEEWAEYEEVKR